MKDKEKQIEEMAKDIPYLTLDRTVFVGATETKNVSWTLSEEDNKIIAETLISKGWIKPDKDSVVLTREEYNEYVELRNSEIAELVKENKVLGKQCLDWMKLYHKQLTKTKQSSKETAEKYSEMVTKFILELFKNARISGSQRDLLLKRNKKLAKQFGVELEQ